ncbi:MULTISPECIES: hypothetical protein [unclassified Tolypothrix]|nr:MULTISPECIES: hypothetical protein [unclassified Tolypothrix]
MRIFTCPFVVMVALFITFIPDYIVIKKAMPNAIAFIKYAIPAN